MSVSRRDLLRATAVGAGALALPGGLAFAPSLNGGQVRRAMLDAPATGFEETGMWTTHADEVALLEQIAAEAPGRVTLTEIGRTAQDRPLHRLTFGALLETDVEPGSMPTTMVLGSQHGNEPAGREAALKLIRDLAYMDLTAEENADIARILATQSIIVVPSANPDGRAAGTRANSRGFDINRDHLRLSTEEAYAFSEVIKEFGPFMALDLHEYGPSVPVLYDDDLLYLWPRNLNVDEGVRTLAKAYCIDYIKKDGEAAGYTADEYGLAKVGPNVAQQQVGGTTNDFAAQTAGGADPGICRNAMGLRHTLGILVESRVTFNPQQSPEELLYDGEGGNIYGDSRAARERRVASQRVVLDSMLRFMDEQGEAAHDVTNGARVRKAREGLDRSAPVYFGGQDDSRPVQADSTNAAEAMASYTVTAADLEGNFELENRGSQSKREGFMRAVAGQAIVTEELENGDLLVPLGQHAEPLIPLLLDARAPGTRRILDKSPDEDA